MRTPCAAVPVLLLLAACTSGRDEVTPGPPVREPGEALMQIADDYWESMMRRWPSWATQLGDRRYDDRLARLDVTSLRATRRELESFRERLAALDREAMTESDRVTADVLDVELRREIGEDEHGFWMWNVDQMYGPQVWLLGLGATHPKDAEGRASYLRRIRLIPRHLEEYETTLRTGLERGVVAPRVVVERVIAQLRDIADTPPDDLALVVKTEPLPGETADAHAAHRDAMLAVVRHDVQPAFARLLQFMEADCLPQAREEIGLAHDEPGRAAYRHRIWYHTSLDLTADEVHRIGLETLAGIRARMEEIARRRGHTGDLASFNAKLRADPAQTYATREDVETHAQRILDAATAALPRIVTRTPRASCVVEPLESFREKDAPAAYYEQPAADGSRPGKYRINTYKPRSRTRYNMPALSLHEAVPGHHLQLALAQELEGVPEFRRHVGVTSYVEGWALYSELLGEEMGLYEDDLAIYGMLNYQAWRAARLVVDTGMHAKGWGRERAVQFLRENLALSEQEIGNEIDRYITWPGQALAYMIGCLEIKALRKQAEGALGDRFDLRAFHDEVLRHGAVPLSVLRAVIERWIARQESA